MKDVDIVERRPRTFKKWKVNRMRKSDLFSIQHKTAMENARAKEKLYEKRRHKPKTDKESMKGKE